MRSGARGCERVTSPARRRLGVGERPSAERKPEGAVPRGITLVMDNIDAKGPFRFEFFLFKENFFFGIGA